MGIIIPVDFFQATFSFTVAGNATPKVTTIGFQPDDPGGTSAADAATVLYNLSIGTNGVFKAADRSTEWTYVGCSVIKQTLTGPLIGFAGTPVAGSATLDVPPPNTTVLIKKITASGGRHNRGRLFIPPLQLGNPNLDAAGFINSTLVGIWQASWNLFFTAVEDLDYHFFVLHSDSTDPTQVTAFSVENQVATQRRRLR